MQAAITDHTWSVAELISVALTVYSQLPTICRKDALRGWRKQIIAVCKIFS